jgi:hypothetical protein
MTYTNESYALLSSSAASITTCSWGETSIIVFCRVILIFECGKLGRKKGKSTLLIGNTELANIA